MDALSVSSNHARSLPTEPPTHTLRAAFAQPPTRYGLKEIKGRESYGAQEKLRAVGLRQGGILSLQSSVITGHVCRERRPQISKKADFISSVAQGTTCLLVQLLYARLPFEPRWCRLRVRVLFSTRAAVLCDLTTPRKRSHTSQQPKTFWIGDLTVQIVCKTLWKVFPLQEKHKNIPP